MYASRDKVGLYTCNNCDKKMPDNAQGLNHWVSIYGPPLGRSFTKAWHFCSYRCLSVLLKRNFKEFNDAR